MIHLTHEEYDNLLRQIDEKTKCIALYAKEKNEQKQRADRAEKRWSELKEHSNDVWMNGDADEHEYAFDVLKLMQLLEEDGE
ncbi:hypothetical protein ETI08_03580 [Macrococcoides goetzii]|nr:hypothetical protein [Macrococcus goetzii]TDM48232.1 hypothetical protein ETI08_03580 [Macrococcus goetzii]